MFSWINFSFGVIVDFWNLDGIPFGEKKKGGGAVVVTQDKKQRREGAINLSLYI